MSTTRTSTGHEHSNADWLDLHFEANRTEYRAALDLVGIQPGWHVLDAATGAGSYLPWIADMVGPRGRISTIDLAPENVEIVRQRLESEWKITVPIDVHAGSVMELPFAAESFDAVWFANTSQYLPDDELEAALAEFKRVLKPGGILALKDVDNGLWATYPGPSNVYFALFEYYRYSDGWNQAKGLNSRMWNMHRWFKDAGFVDVEQRLMPIEWRAPLTPAQREMVRQAGVMFADVVLTHVGSAKQRLPQDVQQYWEIARDPDHPDHPVHHEDFYFRDGQMVVVGRKPME